MIVLVAVGTMNLAAMATLGIVVALEKLWRHGVGVARATGVVHDTGDRSSAESMEMGVEG